MSKDNVDDSKVLKITFSRPVDSFTICAIVHFKDGSSGSMNFRKTYEIYGLKGGSKVIATIAKRDGVYCILDHTVVQKWPIEPKQCIVKIKDPISIDKKGLNHDILKL